MKNIQEKLDATKAEIKKLADEFNNVQEQLNEGNRQQMARKEMLIKLSGKQESLEELLETKEVKPEESKK